MTTPAETSPRSPRVVVIVPTFRRDDRLRDTLRRLAAQTRPPDRVLVIDNAGRPACQEVCATAATAFDLVIDYIPASANLGPAGATALGMERALPLLGDHDLIGRWDDDPPPLGDGHLEWLVTELRPLATASTVGAIGNNGAIWDAKRARFAEPQGNTGGWVEVDYLVTNYLPLFRVEAIRAAGVFRTELFFGLTEAEYGLRLRQHGFRLLAIDLTPDRSTQWPGANAPQGPTWRSYYSARNRIVLARAYGTGMAPVRVVLALILGPVVRHARRPGMMLAQLRWNVRAIRDGLRSRMGRTVEPSQHAGELDLRATSRPMLTPPRID